MKKINTRDRAKIKIRKRIEGSEQKPRLAVYRSLNNIYAQLIDDSTGNTIVAVSSLSKDLQAGLKSAKGKIDKSKMVGSFLAKKALESKGHSVITASNGAEGVEKAKSEKPDLILMDIVMPDMNGFKATREISKNPETSHIPVIIMSSKDQATYMEWAKRQGATSYIVKPVNEDDLLAAVDQALAG